MLYEGMSAYSFDQQPAKMTVSVNFHVLPTEVERVYSGYQTVDNMKTRLIARQIPTQLENVFGRYTAISAVQDRAKLVQDMQAALRKSVDGPVVIDTVQIENQYAFVEPQKLNPSASAVMHFGITPAWSV